MKKGETHGKTAVQAPGTPPMQKNKNWLIPILAILAAVSRLPYIHSPFMFLTGDEAVLGLMAKHTFEGKVIPAFFYGQHYGLCIFETLAGALAFSMGGVSAISFFSF